MNQIENYVRAAAALLQAWAVELDDETRDNLNDVLQAGGMLQIQTAWSRAGHVGTELVLIAPTGERLELAGLELQRGMPQ